MTRKAYTTTDKEVIKKMRESGKGYSEIAKKLNRTKDSINRYCRDNGLGGYRAIATDGSMFTEEIKNLIKTLRNENKGYSEIAKVTGYERTQIKSYCNKNDLGGRRANDYNTDHHAVFLERFNNKYGESFEYISGYENIKSVITIKCMACDSKMAKSASTIIYRHTKCSYCVEEQRRIKSGSIEKEKAIQCVKRKLEALSKQRARELKLNKVCGECGKHFKANHIRTVYCSDACSNRHFNRSKELRRRHAIASGDMDADISLERVADLDNHICYLCGTTCDADDYAISDDGHFIVGPKHPSIEHVKPLSKGGTHTWDNVRLAHHYCNTIKSNN